MSDAAARTPSRADGERGASAAPSILNAGRPLAIPRSEETQAWKLGARFHREARAWFAPPGSDWEALRRYELRVETADRWKAVEAFEHALRSVGIDAPALHEGDLDGRWRRCPVEGSGPSNRAGAFKATFRGDRLFGLMQNWKLHNEPIPFASDAARVEPHVYAALCAQAKIDRARSEAQRQAKQQEAAETASALWAAASTRPRGKGLEYLHRKGLGDERFGARFDREGLLIALRDVDGKIWSTQRIDDQGAKLFLSGGRKQGCLFWIGFPVEGRPIAVVEGFATGASAHLALGHSVAVAFDAGNLEHVALALRERYPSSPLAILGDNDWATELAGKPNKGKLSAIQSAQASGAAWAVPQFAMEGPQAAPPGASDWNDVMGREGLSALRAQLAAGLPAAFAPTAKALASGLAVIRPAPGASAGGAATPESCDLKRLER